MSNHTVKDLERLKSYLPGLSLSLIRCLRCLMRSSPTSSQFSMSSFLFVKISLSSVVTCGPCAKNAAACDLSTSVPRGTRKKSVKSSCLTSRYFSPSLSTISRDNVEASEELSSSSGAALSSKISCFSVFIVSLLMLPFFRRRLMFRTSSVSTIFRRESEI